MRINLAPFIVAAVLSFILSACSLDAINFPQTDVAKDQEGRPSQPGFTDFQDIPIPAGAQVITERSLVLGVRDAWIGRLVLKSKLNVITAFHFFKKRTTEFGWQEITSVRSAISILSYTKGERVLTVQIQSQSWGGAEVSLTVSPRGTDTPDSQIR
mgnify:CR=1 FL=1